MDNSDANYMLLVEDDDVTRDALTTLLEAAGYRVTAAAHGREALERLKSGKRPFLILLDLLMPEMDGCTFNLIAQAECTGRSNASHVWSRNTAAQAGSPGSENWIG